MKINDINFDRIHRTYRQQEKDTVDKKKRSGGDRMEISAKAREIRELEAKLKEIPAIRREKVEKIKKALLNDEYQINAAKIASKIIRDREQE